MYPTEDVNSLWLESNSQQPPPNKLFFTKKHSIQEQHLKHKKLTTRWTIHLSNKAQAP